MPHLFFTKIASEQLELCQRECHGDFDQGPVNANHIEQWCNKKRAIKRHEVSEQIWFKTCTQGYITELHFHPDGRVDEFTLFDRFHINGHWQLRHGILEVVLFKAENQYKFQVIANRIHPVHSAIEYKNGERHAYLKLGQLNPSM
ncbi:hypothetical protein VST7929_01543 [Vibrio stylophorae]|uniref:Uncharacterized protein n=1 Tax=Vibrio stylophorae TaxID=659351 RepID=A0ABM8ZTN4_9VIBR|nr:hypothetical protein [Vibrio stylophorae]CAH0533672.1 hypothetical protein VST7929_01543 [Vibrio stylophorae]